MTPSEHLTISTVNPAVYFAGASKTSSMMPWNRDPSIHRLLDDPFFDCFDYSYTTPAGRIHHRVSWQIDPSASSSAINLMYARWFCVGLITCLPDNAIIAAFQDLIGRYDEAVAESDYHHSSYAVADTQSAKMLRSIIRARIPAVP